MSNTSGQEVFESFESSFRDKEIIPPELEKLWLRKAVARFSVELSPLDYDAGENMFGSVLDGYVIDTLAAMMKQYYVEREVDKVNKRVSIVTKDISVDGNGNGKTAAKNELDYVSSQTESMINNMLPTAYN